MTPERWRKAMALFDAALAREPDRRADFLAEACAGDEGLRREVEAMLAADAAEDNPVDVPVGQLAAEVLGRGGGALEAGSELGPYRIERELGRGGMGEVYLAVDARLGRPVALKLLSAAFLSDPDRVRRFEREARTVSLLNHPNIITIHEVGESGGLRYIATEYVEGETLRDLLARGRLPLGRALEIAGQAAEALAAAHGAGVVHRDIKPENIMVRRDGYVKVLDFGLAKPNELAGAGGGSGGGEVPTLIKLSTTPGLLMGTITYMSPEQARGLRVDARTDIWSLGVVLYEMVAGRRPFEGETPSDTISNILHEEQPALTLLSDEAVERLDEIVAKALTKEKEERYQSAKDLLIDLRNLKKRREAEAESGGRLTPGPGTSAALSDARDRSSVAGAGETAARAATKTGAAHPTSSAPRLGRESGRQKRAVIAASAAVIFSAAVIILYFYPARPGGDTTAIDSIAVLPFVNTSNDPNTEYLSDGIPEALINSLTELRQLRVIARATAFRYKGRDADPQALGRQLNVRAVLMGRVRQAGDALNIQVDLVETRTGTQLWGREYERKVSDVLAVKQAIALEVTEKLRLRLSGVDERQLVGRDTTSAEAYQLYLRGRFHWNKRRVEEHRKAIDYFQQAVAADPNYALGYAGLADTYALLANQGGAPPREAMPKAKEAALRALSLDVGLAEAHASLGMILTHYDWDFAGAETHLKRAIELNPNYASAHQFYGRVLNVRGRHEEALAELRRALELDPLSLPVNWTYGVDLFYARRYDESEAQLKKTQELDTAFSSVQGWLARVHQAQGRYAESVEAWAKSQEMEGKPEVAALMRESFARGGWQGFLRAMTRNPILGPNATVAFYAALGEKDKAFAELDKAYENRANVIGHVKVHPLFDPLRDDPRFQELLRRAGLWP